MKTKVRVQETMITNSHDRREYDHCYIQILEPNKYSRCQHPSMEVIGTITFQGTVAEKGKRDDYWYALRIECSIEPRQSGWMTKMAKLAAFVGANATHNVQPDELLRIIGAEKYISGLGGFIPESLKGMRAYKMMKSGELHDVVYAANDIIANKMLKQKRYANCEVVFDHVV